MQPESKIWLLFSQYDRRFYESFKKKSSNSSNHSKTTVKVFTITWIFRVNSREVFMIQGRIRLKMGVFKRYRRPKNISKNEEKKVRIVNVW